MNLANMETEKRNPQTMDIDRCTTLELVEKINNEDHKPAEAVKHELKRIAAVIDAVSSRMKNGGRLIYIGAGTSGRLGILDAVECRPTYGVSDELIAGLIAGGKDAVFKAHEGAEDSEQLAEEDLKKLQLNANDSVIGLAASGRTPYVEGGLKYARKIGAFTAAVSCVNNAEISPIADVAIEAVTGPEAVTGSTRMKAGTAEKMICNMISTGCMIRYGKVYENLMIDVQPTNEKLVDRAKRIVSEAAGCSIQKAEVLLAESGNSVKRAVLMGLKNCTKTEAEELLKAANGNVHDAIIHAEGEKL